jgi:lipid A 3-O-deacylase PagL
MGYATGRWSSIVAALVCALALAASPVNAEPTLSIGYGSYQEISRAEVGVAFPSQFAGKFRGVDWALAWQADFARWRSSSNNVFGKDHLYDVGFTPRLRVLAEPTRFGRPFVELGVGLHALSGKEISNHELGMPVLFGSFAGIGWRFGAREEFAVAARVLHESNARIREPNDGMTTLLVRLEYTLP